MPKTLLKSCSSCVDATVIEMNVRTHASFPPFSFSESDMDEILFFGSDVSTRFLKFCEFNGHYGRDEALHLLRELSRRKCFKDVAPEGGIQTLEDVRNLEDPNPEGYRVVPKKIKDLW